MRKLICSTPNLHGCNTITQQRITVPRNGTLEANGADRLAELPLPLLPKTLLFHDRRNKV